MNESKRHTDDSTDTDPLAPARGIALGCIISLAILATIAAGIYVVRIAT